LDIAAPYFAAVPDKLEAQIPEVRKLQKIIELPIVKEGSSVSSIQLGPYSQHFIFFVI
jgi:hypothetical protein